MQFSLTSVFAAGLVFVSSVSAIGSNEMAGLSAQNKARLAHNIAAFSWDPTLAASAQTCADTLASTGVFAHCQSGENLYAQSGGSGILMENAATAWLNEEPYYHGEVIPQGNFSDYGHYTQVMWEGSTKVGMAQATGSNGFTYVVAHYDPAGNIVGQTPYPV